jgi:hypothetical protein
LAVVPAAAGADTLTVAAAADDCVPAIGVVAAGAFAVGVAAAGAAACFCCSAFSFSQAAKASF